MSGGTEFAPYKATATGEDKVVSLVLPDAARTITARTSSPWTFSNFTALKEVSGAGITAVSNNAFREHTALTSASFPAATSIGTNAFYQCAALASASFPVATDIGDSAFANCTALASVNIPAAETVTGGSSFYGVGTAADVTTFTITIKANCTFNDTTTLLNLTPNDLVWNSGTPFKTYYESNGSAGGTYTCNTSTGVWTYAP
jgi:hypothetical protein